MTLEAINDEPPATPGLWDEQPWSPDALCAETDPEIFFPEKGGSTRDAKSVCGRCSVQEQCLDWALERDERFGIWGGLSVPERRQILKGRRPKPDLTLVESLPTTPTPPAEVPAMPEPAAPSYVDQILAVMVATEGHPSPDVRAARKVVANALVALNKAVRAAEQPAAEPTPVEPTPEVFERPGKGAASHAIKERIAALGVTPAEVRAYARDQGHDVPVRGQLPAWAIDLYEQAHPSQSTTATTTGDTPA